MSEPMLKATPTERQRIRTIILNGSAEILIASNDDGTWFADVYETIIEAPTAAEVLREVAAVLEEM